MKFEKGSPAEARRKLVRGSIVLPLVMTLRPGVAAAASITCWDKTPAENTTASLLTDNPDGLVRVQVPVYSVNVTSNGNGQRGIWRCYLKNGSYFTTSAQTSGSPSVSLPAYTQIIGGTPTLINGEYDHLLAYVDPSGNILASGPGAQQTGTTKALAMSCWTSIAGTIAG